MLAHECTEANDPKTQKKQSRAEVPDMVSFEL